MLMANFVPVLSEHKTGRAALGGGWGGVTGGISPPRRVNRNPGPLEERVIGIHRRFVGRIIGILLHFCVGGDGGDLSKSCYSCDII